MSNTPHPASQLDPALLAALYEALPRLAVEHRVTLAAFMTRVALEPGTPLFQQGSLDRAAYLPLSGDAKLVRDGIDLGLVRSGRVIGELSLITASPRAASVVAVHRLEVARLSLEAFKELSATHAEAAFGFLETVLSDAETRALLGERRSTLLQDRSLPRGDRVQVTLHGVPRSVTTGIPVRTLLPDRMKGKLVVAALLDRRAVSLSTPLTSECTLVPVTTEHWEGQRIYRQSLTLLALEASTQLGPDVRLEAGPSLGFAQRLWVRGSSGPLERFAVELERAMRTLSQKPVLLREEYWTVDEAREYFERRGVASAVNLLGTFREPAVPLVSYGNVFALRMGPIVPDTSLLSGFHVRSDEEALLLVFGEEGAPRPLPSMAMPAVLPTTVPGLDDEGEFLVRQARKASRHAAPMLVAQDRFLATLGVTSVGAFNRSCIDGVVSQLIRVSEGYQEKLIGRIADEIAARIDHVRIVSIAGPSSSGKTTFIRRLKVQLQVNGVNPVGLSLDDYYVDRARTPTDENGELDFEAFDALQTGLLQAHLGAALAGALVKTARYDFGKGTSDPSGGPEIQLSPRDLLMVEGIHGLNPRLLASLPEERLFRIFVCPLAQLPFDELSRVHASDVRLIRRIVRDRHGRGHGVADTIRRWPSVRNGERKHIFPFQHHADAVFDSSLIYELGVLRVFAERYLLEVPHDDPAYTTAFRLLGLLDRFVTLYPDQVPPTSILREFIGGSGFEY